MTRIDFRGLAAALFIALVTATAAHAEEVVIQATPGTGTLATPGTGTLFWAWLLQLVS